MKDEQELFNLSHPSSFPSEVIMQEQQMMGRESRRLFIKRAALMVAALPAAALGAWAFRDQAIVGQAQAQDWQGARAAPHAVSWRTSITAPDEPGERLIMSGRIFQADGQTPAAGVLLYVYHTDITGYYNHPNKLPARLRGWMRTGADGRYEFRTIKPAPYPGRDFPAHIHATLTADGYPEYWIDDFWFDGDPLITQTKLRTLSGRGGFKAIVSLKRDRDGTLNGQRNLRLEHV
jgi:protocatechuate 3,4-dioxygenase beta subunit